MNTDYFVVHPGSPDRLIMINDRTRYEVDFSPADKSAFLNLPYSLHELDEELLTVSEAVEIPVKVVGVQIAYSDVTSKVPDGGMMHQLMRHSIEHPLNGDVLVTYFMHMRAVQLKGNLEIFVKLVDGRIALLKVWGERQLVSLLRFTVPVLYQNRRVLIKEFLLGQLNENHATRTDRVEKLFDINAHTNFIMPRIDD